MDQATATTPPPVKKRKKHSRKKSSDVTLPYVTPPFAPPSATTDDRIKVFWFDNVYEGRDYRWVHLKRKEKETSFLVGNIPYIISRLANIYKSCKHTDGMKLKSTIQDILNDL